MTTTADTIREMIKHENELYNARMSWFCTIQGLLWTALAISIEHKDVGWVSFMLSCLGVLISASSYKSLNAALLAVKALREWWRAHEPEGYDGPPIIGRTPDRSSVAWLRPHVLFTCSFAVAWLSVGVFLGLRSA